MPFTEILGQAQALHQLEKAMDSGKLAHAYLFEGPAGVGRSMAARALARMLLCPEKGACGGCPVCRMIGEDTHPMVRTYGLAKNSRNIGVDAIRDDLIPFFSLKSAPGEYKMAVINPADALSEDAANMLLKTLEEPGQWSLLILVTATSEALLPTIVSRCQRIRFRRIPQRLITDRLVEKMNLASRHALVIAKLSGGSMGRAMELAGKDFSAWRVRILDEFAGLLTGKTEPLDAARNLLDIPGKSARGLQERRVELGQILDLLLTYIRDLVIAGEKHESSLLHGDRDTLVEEAALLSEEKAMQVFDRIFETKDDLDKNVNMQIALEELCLDAAAVAGHREESND